MKNKKQIIYFVTLSILMAIIIVLQLVASTFKIGTYSFSLVLVPIAVGAILLGPLAGTILGLGFGAVVVFGGDAAFFMGINPFFTIVTVFGKGALAGFLPGIIYLPFKKKNKFLGCVLASMAAPIANSGFFAFCMATLFHSTLVDMAGDGGAKAFTYLFATMIGINFIVEFSINAVLSPTISRICDYGRENLFNEYNEEVSDEVNKSSVEANKKEERFCKYCHARILDSDVKCSVCGAPIPNSDEVEK